MSLQIAAQHLASKGRGPDTELVHMSMDEIKSLQALAKAHGGSLTINPDTGLAEAGFLSKILPMVAGAALTATGVGAPLAALMVGGGYGLATGSLKKGLMAGLGAYGGAGLAGGLQAAGTTAVGEAAGNLAGPVGSGEFGFAANQATAAQNPFQLMGEGAKGLLTEPGRASFMQNIGGLKGLAQYGGALAAPLLFGGEPAQPPGIKPSAPQVPLQFNANAVSPTPQPDVPVYGQLNQDFGRQQQYFNPTYTVAQQPTTPMPMMADGGTVENMSLRNEAETLMANGGQMYAGGGLSHLGDYSDGGRLLRGPGDGVSDSIPAVIGQKQPARLADGEFVVPARIVSELGNGSTEAGARKLYAMMDRVQKVRGQTTGKGNVAKNSRADKYLPA